MASATPVIEWSPTTLPLATPVWVDITSFVLDLSTNRTRPPLLGKVQAGTMDVLLNNNGGQWDPKNTGGANYPNVDLGKRVRFRALYAGVYYPIFDGEIEDILVEWPDPSRSVVKLLVCDWFARLARKRLARDNYRTLMLGQTTPPLLWARMGAGGPGQWWNDSAHAAAARVAQFGNYTAVANTVTGALVTDDDGAQAASSSSYLNITVAGTTARALEFWARIGQAVPNVGNLAAGIANAGGTFYWRWWLMLNGDGTLFLRIHKITTSTGILSVAADSPSTSATVLDGLWHHFVVGRTSGGEWVLDLDGSAGGIAWFPEGVVGAVAQDTQIQMSGFVDDAGNYAPGPALVGQVDEIAVYSGFPADADVDARYTEGRGRWASALTGARIGTVLDTFAWPAGLRDVDAGTEVLDAVDASSTQSSTGAGSGGLLTRVMALDHMQVCCDTEGGLLFVSKTGVVTFRQRPAVANALEATYGENVAGGEVPYSSPPTAETNRTGVINEATVTASRSGLVLASDATSQGKYGIQSKGLSLPMSPLYPERARAKAQRIVNAYAYPVEKQSAIALDLTLDLGSTAVPAIFGHELGSAIRIVRRPAVGTIRTNDRTVIGLAHHVTPQDWTLTVDTDVRYAPAVPSSRIHDSAQVSVPNATWTAVPLAAAYWDDDSTWDASNPTRLYLITPGSWFLSVTGGLAAGAGSTSRGIRLNGTTFLVYRSGPGLYGGCSTIWKTVPGDYIELMMYQGTGAAQNTAAAAADYANDLSAMRIGS